MLSAGRAITAAMPSLPGLLALRAPAAGSLQATRSSRSSSSRSSGSSSAARRSTPVAGAAASSPPPPPPAACAVGEVLEGLRCTSLAYGGRGVCRLPSGYVVFVERALPGEELTARVHSAKRTFAEASKLSTQRPHAHAVPAPCPYHGPCGGCTLQALAYDAQLAAKQAQVRELLARVAGLGEAVAAAALRPILPAPQQLGYRNKLEFSFSTQAWDGRGGADAPGGVPPAAAAEAAGAARGAGSTRAGRHPSQQRQQQQEQQEQQQQQQQQQGRQPAMALGFHRPGSAEEVLPVAACLLQSDAANHILQLVQRELAAAAAAAEGGGGGGGGGAAGS